MYKRQAYGYDVAVAQMLAEELGMELEIHKVEWSSIGISMDAGDYDCIIAGMGRTAEREMSYAFTDPYYYRDNCIVVKKGGAYENVTKLSELAGTGCKVTTQLGTGWVPVSYTHLDVYKRQLIRLAENHAATGNVAAHDGFAVLPGIGKPAEPKGFIKLIVGIARNQPDANFGMQAEKDVYKRQVCS